ncbi:MAG: PIN domain-containing protein [Acidobacteria bacterium]|nr:PIN domain-containing protein [Acidobacteriota bacterium]
MIFVDTGALLARFVKRDQYHSSAQRAWRRLARSHWQCYTTNFVLDETFTLIARRTTYDFAAERALGLLTSDNLIILRPDPEDELQAVALFRKFANQRVSFTDCISFVSMKRQGLRRAFTFDRHFADAGFEIWPSRTTI